MHAVVVGCGRVGSAVASRLAAEGWTVAVIDQSMESFNRLDPAFPGDRVEGHALDEDMLCHAGITRAEACIVCTDGDNTNLVTAQIVQRKYGVREDRRARARPGPRRAVRPPRPAHGVPDDDRDRHALGRGASAPRSRPDVYILIAGGGKVGRNLTKDLLGDGPRGHA